ncbi:fungal specific transcription factor [Colletotrichum tofieldiae]|nr:fungal specific transcription factor [Colletotrichum tofieldiae]
MECVNGQTQSDPGWWVAVNAILAHSLRKKRSRVQNKGEYVVYIQNALRAIPGVITGTPTPLTIGSLLAIVLYYGFTAENHTALTLMSFTVQLLMIAGYHQPEHKNIFSGLLSPESSSSSTADFLHCRRLFWQAYIIERGLIMRSRKLPFITDSLLLDLPDEYPDDGYNIFYYPNDVTLNLFLHQVRLAQIQGHVSAKLHLRTGITASELKAEIRRLDVELHEWHSSLPPSIRAGSVDALLEGDYNRIACLTTLHLTYFQLIVAIHSTVFRLPENHDSLEIDENVPSLTFCTSPHARSDLGLIRNVVSCFEKYDPDHQLVVSYQVTRVMADIATSILTSAPTVPPHLPASSPVPEAQTLNLVPDPKEDFRSQGAVQKLSLEAKSGGGIKAGTTDSLSSTINVSMFDQGQQHQQQGFVELMSDPSLPNEGQFFSRLMGVVDWRLRMDCESFQWPFNGVLDGQVSGQY